MGFWSTIAKGVAASLGGTTSSDVKIQIRERGDTIWRDFGYVASNDESVQGGISLAASAHPDCDVRAMSANGIVDFH